MAVLRYPLVPIGLVLVLIGLGNWYTGFDKTREHEELLAARTVTAADGNFEEFPELTARTNATLLRTLQRGSDGVSLINAKLDFYKVVQSGGRVLMMLGLFFTAAGLIHTWYRQRAAERDVVPPHAL